MNQTSNITKLTSAEDQPLEGRRDVVRKLGKYAAYAAPFTLLASNLKATGAGSGSGGGPYSSPTARRK